MFDDDGEFEEVFTDYDSSAALAWGRQKRNLQSSVPR